jgi:glycosyltransferase involved in cell wall biosynthesis
MASLSPAARTISKMMRPFTILSIADWYLPGTKAGGPVQSISRMVETLGDELKFLVITRPHDLGNPDLYRDVRIGEWNTVGQAKVYYLRPEGFLAFDLVRTVNITEHDIVQLNSVFSSLTLAYLIARRLRLVRYATVAVAPRGELGENAMTLKARRKALFLRIARLSGLFKGVTWSASSSFERDDILSVFGRRTGDVQEPTIRIVPDIARELPSLEAPATIKSAGKARLIFLSRIDRKKNLHRALQMLQGVRGAIDFDVYGPSADLGYLRECRTIAEGMPDNINVRFMGELLPEQVPHVLSQYDLLFLPTLNENFGHVIIEAMAAGCPALISDQTAWRSLAEARAGWDVELSNESRFQSVIAGVVAMSNEEMSAMRAGARAYAHRAVEQTNAIAAHRALFCHGGVE